MPAILLVPFVWLVRSRVPPAGRELPVRRDRRRADLARPRPVRAGDPGPPGPDRGLRVRDGLLVRRRGRLGLVHRPRRRGHVLDGRDPARPRPRTARPLLVGLLLGWRRWPGSPSGLTAPFFVAMLVAGRPAAPAARRRRALRERSAGCVLFGLGLAIPAALYGSVRPRPLGQRSSTRATCSSRACSTTPSTPSTGSWPSSTSRATSTRSSCAAGTTSTTRRSCSRPGGACRCS